MFEKNWRALLPAVVVAFTATACFPPVPEDEDAVDSTSVDTVDVDSVTVDTAIEDDTAAPPDTAEPDTIDVEVSDTTGEDTTPLDTSADVQDTVQPDTTPPCPESCPAPAEPCKVSVCDPAQGACVVRDADDGATCDDGLFCTVGDRCVDGACLSTPRDCGDTADCTVDTCDDDVDTCLHDGLSCECGPGVSCEDGNPCNGVDSCDLTTYSCVHTNAPAENVPCDDGLFCTTDDRCRSGVCEGVTRSCGDALSCTADSCDENNDRCVNDQSACTCVDASGCPDDNLCDGTASCDTEHDVCDPGTPVVCDAPTGVCKVAGCDPTTGSCEVADADDGTTCDDQSVCTTNDQCTGGTCGGSSITCTPPNACQQSAGCDSVDGCQFVPKAGTCTFSTGVTGTCSDGQCRAPVCSPACEHGGLCVAPDTCDCSGTGYHGNGCQNEDPCGVLGVPCPDGFECTEHGTCENAVEVFVPAGQFWMGCNPSKEDCSECTEDCYPPNESPRHLVTLSGYAIDKNKATVAAYEACLGAGGCETPCYLTSEGHPNRPADGISPEMAVAFCEWEGEYDLTLETAKGLCTEAQWEMAARGGCGTIAGGSDSETCKAGMRTYPWGEAASTCELAWTSGCGQLNEYLTVGSLPGGRSPYGALDMGGNNAEWTANATYAYTMSPRTDPPPDYSSFSTAPFIVRGASARASSRQEDLGDCGGHAIRCCRPVP